ncbi:ribonuclease inhibitor [Dyadobacter sp. CY326]|uniref:ribonuclease inhibitor n=1 Tax=Dyadobacter sp. CY326 TaxID=2907300 RepID=UPI001F1C46D9|nr:ribonuclease inhibitor [Dyadobacter sp. CY326]MCE7065035.1 ribonuclease inhibitor [Dyadobacter sp. CY326]
MSKQFIINGNSIQDIASFYEEINRLFMADEDWKIGNSLDAFNDLLYGGFGALRNVDSAEIVWLSIDKSSEALGIATTRNYYMDKLKPDSPFNKKHFEEELVRLENGTGETYFDTIIEIIREHPNLTLVGYISEG